MIVKPKVSVIIPVYNTELYVEETVRSVLSQTLTEIEVIIINDGSTDNSLGILSELALQDSRIKLLSQNNQGLSITRNNGIKEAVGEYIYFMDSDDLLDADTLECCYKECVAKGLDFTFFEAVILQDDESETIELGFDYERKVMQPGLVYNGREALALQVEQSEFHSSACLSFINRTFLIENKLCFYPKILHEDQLFTFQLYLNAKRIAYLDRGFFHRRVRKDSIVTRAFTKINMVGYKTVANEILKLKTKNQEDTELIDLFLSKMLDAAVWKAHVMPFRDRVKLFVECIFYWRDYISFKTLVVLLLKSTYQKWHH